jgi:hypothetical protein
VPRRSSHARHPVGHNAPTKPRRLMASLALPTVAALALTLTASGAAMATSPKSTSVTVGHNAAAVTVPQAAAVELDAIRTRGIKTAEHNLDVARAAAAARAARSAERVKLVALVSQVARAAQAHGWQLPVKGYVLTSGFGPRGGAFTPARTSRSR